MRMQIGNNVAEIDGKIVTLSNSPLVLNNVAMIPVDFIQKGFGGEVQFDGTSINISTEGFKTPKIIFRDSKNTRTFGNCNQKNDQILKLIRETSKSIYVQIDKLTDSIIIDELIKASKKGVDVNILLDSNIENISNATGYDEKGEKVTLVLENCPGQSNNMPLGKWKVWGSNASFEDNQNALVVTSMEKIEDIDMQELVSYLVVDIYDIGWGSKEKTFESNGADIRWHDYSKYSKMNRKFAVFDEKNVWLGSSSWTWSSFEGDMESEIVFYNPEIAKEFSMQFFKDWGISSQSFQNSIE
jgi:phosphatidylserine/phosphatidylglycerophosphate/cardiolipin synthase-like enzyme